MHITKKRSQFITYLLLLSIILSWSYGWVITKIGLESIPPFKFAALRFFIGSLCMLLVLLIFRAPLFPKGLWFKTIILGLLQTTSVFLLVLYGMMFINVGQASIIIYSMPIWSAIIGYLVLKEKISSRQVIGLGISLIGLISILGLDLILSSNWNVILGEFLLMLGAISWGASNIYMKKNFTSSNKLTISAWQMIFGTIGISIASLIMEFHKPINWSTEALLIVLFTGIIASAYCFTGWYFILSKVNTTVASASLLFIPLLSILFEWMILGKHLTVSTLVSVIFITIGVYLVSVKHATQTRQKKKTELSLEKTNDV
ncbi:DMT family transporter [Priestia megaterium]|uniref:DMT family transporter n=1 Tax=Priestia megaterium TaxID=1404 RepID=UPI002079C591|nr:DMT family transporter [Priestia megaterium]USL45316.1 DMT family transporter [Priestia megaterium]